MLKSNKVFVIGLLLVSFLVGCLIRRGTYSADVSSDVIKFDYSLYVDDNNKMIKFITQKTPISTLVGKVSVSSGHSLETKVLSSSGKVKTDSSIVCTGDVLSIKVNNTEFKYNLSVLGDLTGDGEVRLLDLAPLRKHIAGSIDENGEIYELSGVHYYASNINEDSKLSLKDLGYVRKLIAGFDEIYSIKLNKTKVSLKEGDTYSLKYYVTPDDVVDKGVKWTSDNKSVATVNSNGKITAVGEGTAKITVTTNVSGKKKVATVTVSKKEIEVVSGPVVTSVTNDGVIVKIDSKKDSSNISGYYFSYTNKRPDKSGGYLETSSESIEVVRLPGTTYVWVEDASGKISSPSTITLGNDILPNTLNEGNVLQGKRLSTHISENGGSIEEFNKLIARSVRAAGLYTKEGSATAAVSLTLVLFQKYGVKIPYQLDEKREVYGAHVDWGGTVSGQTYFGIDCGGFVNWSYYNAGVVYDDMNADNYFLWPVKDNLAYSKENGEVGDIIRRPGVVGVSIEHVAIIVGKTNDSFIVAEAYGSGKGVVVNTYPYNEDRDYTIIEGGRLFEKYNEVSSSSYPSGF